MSCIRCVVICQQLLVSLIWRCRGAATGLTASSQTCWSCVSVSGSKHLRCFEALGMTTCPRANCKWEYAHPSLKPLWLSCSRPRPAPTHIRSLCNYLPFSPLPQAVKAAVSRLPASASLSQVEGDVIESVQKAARWFNQRKPEVIAVAWEHDPRAALVPDLATQQASRPRRPPGVCRFGFGF